MARRGQKTDSTTARTKAGRPRKLTAERLALHRRAGKTWETIAREEKVSMRTVHRIAGAARREDPGWPHADLLEPAPLRPAPVRDPLRDPLRDSGEGIASAAPADRRAWVLRQLVGLASSAPREQDQIKALEVIARMSPDDGASTKPERDDIDEAELDEILIERSRGADERAGASVYAPIVKLVDSATG